MNPLVRTAAAWLATIATVAAGDMPSHPRLLFTADMEPQIRARIESDPVVAMVRDAVLVSADAAVRKRTCEYRIPDGKRLLAESRHAIDIVLHTAMAWRLAGRQEHFDRCVKELDAACSLRDWNPSHFLDTAEMATAVALGLDWLHDHLPEAKRAVYREALAVKAIAPAHEQFAKKAGWTKVHNNWSQVCGAGIAIASATVCDDRASLDASPFAACLDIVERSARFYEPDGAYPEGPGYWNYGTEYHVLGLAVAESLGLRSEVPKPLLAGAVFMAHVRGPTGTFFNFADAGPSTDTFVAPRSWLASRSGDAALAADLRESLWSRRETFRAKGGNDRFFPLHLIWLPEPPASRASLPLAAAFGGEQSVAMLRSAWDDPRALFVAAKGGTPKASHGHMDVGSFVVEAAGRRWIHDLGADDYNLPGYFAGKRWDYFRLNALSHNVPLFAGSLQNPACAPCPIVASSLDHPPFSVRFDLTNAYVFGETRFASKVEREIMLDPATRTIRVRDTFDDPAADIRWQCVVDVEPKLTANRAVLERDGKAIALEIMPATAAWGSQRAKPPTADERQNDGFWILFADLPPSNDATQPMRRLTAEVVITSPAAHSRGFQRLPKPGE